MHGGGADGTLVKRGWKGGGGGGLAAGRDSSRLSSKEEQAWGSWSDSTLLQRTVGQGGATQRACQMETSMLYLPGQQQAFSLQVRGAKQQVQLVMQSCHLSSCLWPFPNGDCPHGQGAVQ